MFFFHLFWPALKTFLILFNNLLINLTYFTMRPVNVYMWQGEFQYWYLLNVNAVLCYSSIMRLQMAQRLQTWEIMCSQDSNLRPPAYYVDNPQTELRTARTVTLVYLKILFTKSVANSYDMPSITILCHPKVSL